MHLVTRTRGLLLLLLCCCCCCCCVTNARLCDASPGRSTVDRQRRPGAHPVAGSQCALPGSLQAVCLTRRRGKALQMRPQSSIVAFSMRAHTCSIALRPCGAVLPACVIISLTACRTLLDTLHVQLVCRCKPVAHLARDVTRTLTVITVLHYPRVKSDQHLGCAPARHRCFAHFPERNLSTSLHLCAGPARRLEPQWRGDRCYSARRPAPHMAVPRLLRREGAPYKDSDRSR